jgi:hypothetical protein
MAEWSKAVDLRPTIVKMRGFDSLSVHYQKNQDLLQSHCDLQNISFIIIKYLYNHLIIIKLLKYNTIINIIMFRIIRKIYFSDKDIGSIIRKSQLSYKRKYCISTEDAICDTLIQQSNEIKDIRIRIDYLIYELNKIDRRLTINEYTSKELLTTNLHTVAKLNNIQNQLKNR